MASLSGTRWLDIGSRDNDFTCKGQAALNLINEVADTISEAEERLESRLLQAMDELQTAEDRNGLLIARTAEAECRASEAVKWLKRLYDEMEAKLSSGIQPVRARVRDQDALCKVQGELLQRIPDDSLCAVVRDKSTTSNLLAAKELSKKQFDLKTIF